MSYNVGLIKIGGLIVPTSTFANHLCHLGEMNANINAVGKLSKYSGMMNFGKAGFEFRYISKIFNIPFFIIGLSNVY